MKKERLSRLTFVVPAAALLAAAAAGSARGELVYVSLQSSVVSFDLSSGVGSTIAATKTTVASGLTEAMGLVFGGDGNLYVANYTPGTVSRINLGTQAVTSFASGFTDPRGITYSGSGNTFYVANSGSPGSISQVTSGGTVSDDPYVAFGSNTSPYGLALDATGALYSANNANASISKIVGGVPSTFTNFTLGQGVRGVAVAANGDVYSTVGTGVKVTTPGGSTSDLVSGLSFPFGLAFDTTGDILVADYSNQTISAYDTAGALQYSFSTGPFSSDRPRYVAFDVPGSGFNQIVPEPAMGIAVLSVACSAFLAYRRRQRARPFSKPTPTTERA